MKIQLEVLNEGTSQKLKSLDDENKKNIQFYNNVQAEVNSYYYFLHIVYVKFKL